MTDDTGSRARPKLLESLKGALSSRRTAAVTLLSFSSGLPLGLVWIAIPDWMRKSGVDIRIVGLITLAHAPWAFKVLWSPLMDRYTPSFLGRRRGWIAIMQVALLVLTLLLAGLGGNPDLPWVILAMAMAIAFASASQDIVIDAYAVDVLRPEEQAVAVGARTALYRAAMFVAGALAITLAGSISWAAVNVFLALLYIPALVVTWFAPEAEARITSPATLREAVWLPFLGFLGRHRALEILAFVLLYKLADNLSQSLLRPFLVDMGYSDFDRGLALGTVGWSVTLVGTFVGGMLTPTWGLGRCLWIFGLLQIFSNIGYIVVTQHPGSRPVMFGAMSFEMLTTGLGMGAFGVLLLRMTQKRFSATQYALFSSLFALPRLVAGPVTGFTVYAVGWTNFFWFTMLAGVPGMLMLARFVPWNARELTFKVEPPKYREPLTAFGLSIRALAGGLAGAAFALLVMAALAALEGLKDGSGFDVLGPFLTQLRPDEASEIFKLLGAAVFGCASGLLTAAVYAARHGASPDQES